MSPVESENGHQTKEASMTHRDLRAFIVLAVSLVAFGMLTQPFAHSKMYGHPEVSYLPYGYGLIWGFVGWHAVCRWQELRIWESAPIWAGALLTAIASLLLSRAFLNDEGSASGLIGLIPIFCWGGWIADRTKAQVVQLDETSKMFTELILFGWYLKSIEIMWFPSSLYGLVFLAVAAWRTPLRQSMANSIVSCVGFTALLIAISPYRQEKLLRWLGFGELPWEYVRERVLASLNSPGIEPFPLAFANDDFLLTSLIEWQHSYFPGLAVGAVAIGLPAWATYSLWQNKAGTWHRAFGLGLAGCLLPIACTSFLSNLGLAMTHMRGLPGFAPDIPCLIYGVLLLGSLAATRSVSSHQPHLD